jgi:GntR family transcriptional regulator
MDQIKLQINTGILSPNSEMASTRSLSAELNLNPMTISKAYNLLEREGVLERRRGQTLVVRERASDETETDKLEYLREQLTETVKLARQLGVSRTQATKLFRETYDSLQS